jgi:acetyl/propionyl-CoA carboxylase alpha subunit
MTAVSQVPTQRRVLRLQVEIAGSLRQVTVELVAGDSSQVMVSWDDTRYVVDAVPRAGGLSLTMPVGPWASREVTCHALASGDVRIGLDGRQVTVRVGDGRRGRDAAASGAAGDHAIVASMPGRVVRVSVEPGDVVTRGQQVVAVEAMKMENALASPIDGVVSEVRVAVDDTVEAATVLVVVSADDTEPATP